MKIWQIIVLLLLVANATTTWISIVHLHNDLVFVDNAVVRMQLEKILDNALENPK